MSKRPIEAKKLNRLTKLYRQTPEPWIDLVQWLRLRSRISERKALAIIADGKVRSESHTLTNRLVPANLRGTIHVLP